MLTCTPVINVFCQNLCFINNIIYSTWNSYGPNIYAIIGKLLEIFSWKKGLISGLLFSFFVLGTFIFTSIADGVVKSDDKEEKKKWTNNINF